MCDCLCTKLLPAKSCRTRNVEMNNCECIKLLDFFLTLDQTISHWREIWRRQNFARTFRFECVRILVWLLLIVCTLTTPLALRKNQKVLSFKFLFYMWSCTICLLSYIQELKCVSAFLENRSIIFLLRTYTICRNMSKLLTIFWMMEIHFT